MEYVDLLPPTAPSFVFARETCTLYYKERNYETESRTFTREWSLDGATARQMYSSLHELFETMPNCDFFGLVVHPSDNKKVDLWKR